MSRPPFRRRPYIDWSIDRWKIGIALLLVLILFATRENALPQMPSEEPTPVSTVPSSAASPTEAVTAAATSLPGQEPTLSAPTQAALGEPDLPSPTAPPPQEVTPTVAAPPPLTANLLGAEASLLRNSRPVLFGQAPGEQIELTLNQETFQVPVREDGQWQFVAPEPLPLGMNWAQVRLSQTGVESEQIMLIVGPGARPVSPPTVDSLPGSGPIQTSTPLLSGSAPESSSLVMVEEKAGATTILGPVQVDRSGQWRWQPASPLSPGLHQLRVVALDAQGVPLTQSELLRLEIGQDAQTRQPPAIDPPLPEPSVGAPPVITSLAGRATPGARLFLYINSQWVDELSADEQGTWRYPFPDPLTADGQNIQIVEVDQSGRPLAFSARSQLVQSGANTSTD